MLWLHACLVYAIMEDEQNEPQLFKSLKDAKKYVAISCKGFEEEYGDSEADEAVPRYQPRVVVTASSSDAVAQIISKFDSDYEKAWDFTKLQPSRHKPLGPKKPEPRPSHKPKPRRVTKASVSDAPRRLATKPPLVQQHSLCVTLERGDPCDEPIFAVPSKLFARPPPPPPSASAPAPPHRSRIDTTIPLLDQKWYHGSMTRESAEAMLSHYDCFSFLVRRSESAAQRVYVLSIKNRQGVYKYVHLKIAEVKPLEFVLGQFSQPFKTVPLCIDFYTQSALTIKGMEHHRLGYPVPRIPGLFSSVK